MATKPASPPVDALRVQDIAAAIRAACTPIVAADEARTEAAEGLQVAAASATSLRESIMISVAELSQAGQWTQGEISAAAIKAVGMSNNASDKALATFIGETKRAMHPDVRSHVPALVALRDLAWEAETLAMKVDKDAPAPLRKASKRQYHLLVAMFGAAGEGEVLTTHSELVAWAEARDPDLDVSKVMKRLDGIKSQLAAFYTDFPVDDIQVCVGTLNDIEKRDLVKARATRTGVVADTAAQPKPIDVPKVVRAFTPSPTVVDDSSGPAQGAVDLDDILGPDTVSTVGIGASLDIAA